MNLDYHNKDIFQYAQRLQTPPELYHTADFFNCAAERRRA